MRALNVGHASSRVFFVGGIGSGTGAGMYMNIHSRTHSVPYINNDTSIVRRIRSLAQTRMRDTGAQNKFVHANSSAIIMRT